MTGHFAAAGWKRPCGGLSLTVPVGACREFQPVCNPLKEANDETIELRKSEIRRSRQNGNFLRAR